MDALAEQAIKRANAAFEIQQVQVPGWMDACSFCHSEKAWNMTSADGMSMSRQAFTPNPRLYNSTAAQALQDMASGIQSSFIPGSGPAWFKWEAADELPNSKSPRLEQYFLNATKRAMKLMERAAFYARSQEAITDAGAIGTAALYITGPRPGSKSPLNFEVWDIGSYAIRQDCVGAVNGIWRRVIYTVDQAEKMWRDYRPKEWARLTEIQKMTKEQTFLWEVMTRDEEEVGQVPGPKGMPIAVRIIDETLGNVVEDGGDEEFPVVVYRYYKPSSTNPWGVGPGVRSLADIRGLNLLDATIADGVMKQVDPPVVVADSMRGTLNLTPGGVSAVSNLNEAPKPIYTVGNIQAGMEFLKVKTQIVRAHFHADLFAFFMNDRSYKTATEANAIRGEKLDLFAPFGYQFMNGFADPVLERVFMVLWRQDLFGPLPPEAVVRDDRGRLKFLYPQSVQQSRMATALREQGNNELRQALADVLPVMQIDQTTVNNIDTNKLFRHFFSGSVAMPDVMRTPEDAAAMTQMQMQAAQQQEAMKLAAQFATKNPEIALNAAQSAA